MPVKYQRKPRVKSRRDPAPAVALCQPGRPSVYHPDYPELARRCKLLGHTDAEMAVFFGVSKETMTEWKTVHSEFSRACAEGGEPFDMRVAKALGERALGYEWKEEQAVKVRVGSKEEVRIIEVTRRVPPDTNAANLWLGNRQRKRWSMRPETQPADDDGKDSVDIKITGGLPEE